MLLNCRLRKMRWSSVGTLVSYVECIDAVGRVFSLSLMFSC